VRKGSGSSPRTTLNQVARKAGVSVTTVSMVLAGKAAENRISEPTLHRVLDAATELDYSPNLLVRSLRHGRTNILSFLNAFRNRQTDDLYMDRLSTAVERSVGKHGLNLLVFCDFGISTDDTYRFLNGGHSDGLLFFAPRADDALLPLMRASRQPVVLINARDEHGVLPSVRDDVLSGMRQVASEWVRLGHRSIGAITESWQSPGDASTRIGLLGQHLAEHGARIAEGGVVEYADDTDGLLADILARPDAPTALFCWRDFVAYRMLEACDRLGVKVPGQLSVVGYDGLHWPAVTHHIAASVHVDLVGLADAAVHLLDRLILGYEGEVIEETISVTLTPGTTLGPPDSQ